MLTIFSIPKAFNGWTGEIQRNAIKSWTLLEPKCQVILVGDDEGTDRAAEELGVRHITGVDCNEFGTPLLNHSFQLAEGESQFPLICHINADIILTSDFIKAVQIANEQSSSFLMTARRWDYSVKDPIDFELDWEDRLLVDVRQNGRLDVPTGIDFWVYNKGLVDNMPPLAVGRIATESWLLYTAKRRGANLIDCTRMVTSIHQNHDYTHVAGGVVGLGNGIEAQRNRQMVGGKPYFFTIRDRTHILTTKGLKRSRDGWTVWRGIRTASVLHPAMPWPLKLAVKALNSPIDVGRDLMIKARDATVKRVRV
jgi:hypothetical protein